MSDDDDDNPEGEEEEYDSANDIAFDIRIMDEDDEPIEGVTVKVWSTFGSWGRCPAYPDKEETDSDGWAHFVKSAPFRKMIDGGVTLDILVGDTTIAEDVWVEDGDTFSYTVDRGSI